MKEYKFRAWDKDKSEMLYFDLRKLIGHWSGAVFDFETKVDISHSPNIGETTFISDADIMQFTGYTDSSGKGIYEGDILYDESREDGYKYYLVEELHDFSYEVRECMIIVSEVKVVGNIYKNEELLDKIT